MKTSTGRKLAIATSLSLLLAGSALTVGSTTVLPPPTPMSSSCSTIDDATLANNVRDELAKILSTRVMGNIQITAKHRVVTLKGGVTYLRTKALAATLARKVKCVSWVINHIVYTPPTEECDNGFQNCCCPETGCECARICLTCGAKRQPARHRRRR
jgi:osmotically-inducible protein OsmY